MSPTAEMSLCIDPDCRACRPRPEDLCRNPACPMEAEYGKAGYCAACHQYRHRYGVERPATLTQPAPRPAVQRERHHHDPRCANPACPLPSAPNARRCSACHVYRWRHGTERPLRLTRRDLWRCATCGSARRGRYRDVCIACYMRARRRARREAVAS